jgi:signal transduction histidine kinase
VGPAPLYGAILFFVVCTIVGMRMSIAVSVAWVVAATVSLMVCLVVSGDRNWVSTMISFGVGFFAFSAFSIAYRRSQQAHAESEQLLAELTSAQGRLRDLAVMDERQRIAREMHDAVGHRLTAAAVLLEGAARLIPREPARAAAMVETSRVQVREGLDELRTAVGALNAVPGGDQPLARVLGALADIAAQGTGINVSLTIVPGLPEPDQQRRVVIVRTVQEGLTNVQKHAGASRAELALSLDAGTWTLTCRDDGRGPAPVTAGGAGDLAHGFGLKNLSARAAELGGTVELLREGNGTTTLRLLLPAGLDGWRAGAADPGGGRA